MIKAGGRPRVPFGVRPHKHGVVLKEVSSTEYSPVIIQLYAPGLLAPRSKMVRDPCASRVARTLLLDLGAGEHAHRVPHDLDRHVGLVR